MGVVGVFVIVLFLNTRIFFEPVDPKPFGVELPISALDVALVTILLSADKLFWGQVL